MFVYKYTVSLSDTDAAGVMFFANQFRIIHYAYEAYLDSIGYGIKSILSEKLFALPIIHADSDFLAPITIGDVLEIRILPNLLSATTFSMNYEIYNSHFLCGKAKTIHVSIDPDTSKKINLPDNFSNKLKESVENMD